MMDFKETIKKHIYLLLIVIITNITIHEVCKNYGCDHWTTIFGHNIICNYCLDYLKDYQFMLYGSIITSLTLQITQITEVIKSGNLKKE